jgi:hypothetical protein
MDHCRLSLCRCLSIQSVIASRKIPWMGLRERLLSAFRFQYISGARYNAVATCLPFM